MALTLDVGTRLGAYEILALIGSGGMGEVYRARDTNLGREVAIKVLPELFVGDPDRIARFRREAQLLATLSHPRIAVVHGFEECDHVRFLVMELVAGESVADRIRHGKVPVFEALNLARQIAEALHAAHEKGIVHRDLKPANVMVDAEGDVKVLDFGLAKMVEADSPAASTSTSPTLTTPATSIGVILGTAAYMSPEQARGKPADKRSDVWAFGCVLFEMLAGERPFDGEDVTDTIAAVVRGEPKWNALPADVPADTIRLLRRCLEKDSRRRFGDMSAPLFLLEDRHDVRAATPDAEARRRPLWRRALPIAAGFVAGLIVAGASAWSLLAPPAHRSGLTRFAIRLDQNQSFTNVGRQLLAVSPDGRRIAYVADKKLWLRNLADPQARPLPGSDRFEAVASPAFSPDGQWIAFWAQDRDQSGLKRILAEGGTASSICPAENPLGISWDGERILFGERGQGILRVPAVGGHPELFVRTKPDEVPYGPQMLPGGNAVLFTVAPVRDGRMDLEAASVVAQSLASGNRTVLVESASDGRFLPSGHLVYAVGGVIFAARFDSRHLAISGNAVPVIEGVRRAAGANAAAAQFSASEEGTLAYIAGPAVATATNRFGLAMFDRDGHATALKMPPDAYRGARISPDGTRLAVGTDDGKDAAIWIYDLSGATARRRLTIEARNRFPTWTPDGRRVTFQSDRESDQGIFWQQADGTGNAERLTKAEPGTSQIPESWSADGRTLLFTVLKGDQSALWTYSSSDKRSAPFGQVQGRQLSLSASFSRDGAWVVYNADTRIYVLPFPATGARYQIAGGIHPFWSPDERELYFTQREPGVVAVPVSTKPTFTFGDPVPLPQQGLRVAGYRGEGPAGRRSIDISPDGKSFVGTVLAGTEIPESDREIEVVEHWFEELKARLPVK